MHDAAYQFVARTVAQWKPRRQVCEIGSRNINGSVRPLFTHADRYVGIDMMPGQGVDVVADGATYTDPMPFDTVVCCEALEHAEHADQILANVWRMLLPDGIAILTMAGEGRAPHSAQDGGVLQPGEFYRNVTEADLYRWCRAFETVRVEANAADGDLYAVAVKGRI